VNGKTGYLVNTVEECVQRVLSLLKDPEKAREMGRAGREFVRDNFLITRYLRDYLRVFREMRGIKPPRGESAATAARVLD
jgi:trehalose synthase